MIDDSWIAEGEPWPDENDEHLGANIRVIKALPSVIKTRYTELRKARAVVGDFQNKLRQAQWALDDLETDVNGLRKVLAQALDVPLEFFFLGSWECLHSPTGFCFYNTEHDSACDFCLLCGGPDERK